MTITRPVRMAHTFSFGGADRYLAAIADPQTVSSPVGAIIWGMGLGEMRVARALIKLGVTVMHIVREEYSLPELDACGAERGREAMDVLRSKRGIERFVFMGNCAFASISFHTALRDDRVVGLILSNPHVSELQSLPSTFRRKLLSIASWRRVLAGKVTLAQQLANARWWKEIVAARMRGLDEGALIAKTEYNKDLTMPEDIGGKLAALGARGVHTLVAFSRNDASLDYFRAAFGPDFAGLGKVEGLTIEELPTDAHLVTIDDEAARLIAEAAARWIERVDWAEAGRPRREASPARTSGTNRGREEITRLATQPAHGAVEQEALR